MRRCDHTLTPTNEPKLNNPTEVQDAIRGLKFGKVTDPDFFPNRALKHLPISVVCRLVFYLTRFFNAVHLGCLEARARVFDILTWERPGTTLILSTLKSTKHNWPTLPENPALHDSLRSELTRIIA